MKEKLEQLKAQLTSELGTAADPKALEDLRVKYLGKKGSITDLLKGMKSLSNDEKKSFGQMVNSLKQEAAESIARRAEELKELEIRREIEMTPEFDLTIPTKDQRGSYHPITLVQRECERIFTTMGFHVEDYPEVVTDYECFEAVNVPKNHPARDMQDTYYLENGEPSSESTANSSWRTVCRSARSSPADVLETKRPTRPTRTPSSRWRA